MFDFKKNARKFKCNINIKIDCGSTVAFLRYDFPKESVANPVPVRVAVACLGARAEVEVDGQTPAAQAVASMPNSCQK